MKTFMDAIQNNDELKKRFEEITGKEHSGQIDYTDGHIALASFALIAFQYPYT